MKKLLIITIVFLFAFTANLFAQESVNVTADVLATIELASTDVEFGNVQQGSTAYVQANSNDNASTNASGPVSGTLSVTADNQDYTVEVTQSAILSDGGTGVDENTLAFTHTIYLDTENVTGDVDGAGYNVEGGGNETFDIGGELASSSEAGSYSTATGDSGQPLIFTVSYTGF